MSYSTERSVRKELSQDASHLPSKLTALIVRGLEGMGKCVIPFCGGVSFYLYGRFSSVLQT